ncbi:hypothetical protein E2C01_002050 [Portunus trituberculatus]|uniref:Uncharacterized protein n=1 Tax=Portunus trituberculatus TaxID=210409 RepID=A0A5B7CJY2_PORTR|nr:hypothetical protein [Portunus trituberculatus]
MFGKCHKCIREAILSLALASEDLSRRRRRCPSTAGSPPPPTPCMALHQYYSKAAVTSVPLHAMPTPEIG